MGDGKLFICCNEKGAFAAQTLKPWACVFNTFAALCNIGLPVWNSESTRACCSQFKLLIMSLIRLTSLFLLKQKSILMTFIVCQVNLKMSMNENCIVARYNRLVFFSANRGIGWIEVFVGNAHRCILTVSSNPVAAFTFRMCVSANKRGTLSCLYLRNTFAKLAHSWRQRKSDVIRVFFNRFRRGRWQRLPARWFHGGICGSSQLTLVIVL